MSYLKFEKALMTNLQDSLPRELLRTNRSGAYSCSTIVDCNTRKYHGLLVVPVPELDDENHVLLSSLDPTVIQHGASFNLGLHKYQGNNFSPQGHKYIREFDCDTVPTTLYRVGGVLLKKEVVFQHYEDRILIRYTLLEAHSKTTLQFRPFLAFRSVRQFTHENGAANRSYEVVDNGISMCMYAGYPSLFMQFSKKNEFHFEPYWYRGLEYPKEQERGYASNEDLYVPGFFEMNISKGESIVFAASTAECRTSTLKNLFDKEVESRSPRDNFFHCLVNAAHQFHNRTKNDERYILAGYPWFKCRARDQFIALPGLTLSIEEQDYFELVMETAAKGLREFMEGKPLSVKIYEMDKPDVPLWCVWSIQQYAKEAGKERCRKLYMGLIRDIVDYLLASKHPNLTLDTNGLLYADAKGEAITWMNSMNNGQPVVPRSGYIVEFNALWYNVLRFTAAMEMESGNEERANELDALAEKCKVSFVETFLNEYGYLYDYVDGRMVDWSVRPNMVFAVALDYSPLDQKQRRGVLDVCTRELLTPKGLRSLSPKSGGYNPMYTGPQSQRDLAYHQGTAWPWLGGFYLEACLKLYKQTRLSFVERQLVGYEDEMINHCLSTLPELFDGNPPFNGRGAISFAMNVAEVLRTLELLEKYKF
ncbi:glycogen debranching enzyme N-terminal domain-containing protein [Prevotella melaninogenica]|uniref:Glycogen debranching enzyme N-terminal domain-containing protein n=1 Tax=Prevotella melaninogenica TaxID=28132 RepID=A0A7D4GSW3_9BACT|nr:glycogen debranching enzyme N-terminal domain-containing protein [Prevotella melaninogenica]EFC72354.1 putative glycogen debranching enzyme, archaeal type [Prevotella melaninogenica D18]QKH88971.1 glycogen debranching enzyme N-terminal domain-containing protein [Prevotella melaninogenica]